LKRKKPLFTVIIPTYNRAKLLKKAIQSVIDQTISDWELVVVDDGSTDETKETVTKFEKENIRYVFQKNQKLGAARNTGIKNARGKYICFLDDDDYYLENYLQVFYDWLAQHDFPDTILRAGFIFRSLKGDINGPSYSEQKYDHPVNWAMFNFCGSVTLCLPKICFKDDQFVPGTEPWEDTHFILRILSKFPFVQLPSFTYIYVRHRVMGSIKIYTEQDTLKMVEQNINSMRSFFDHHKNIVDKYALYQAESMIISEKYSQHALNAMLFEKYKISFQFFRLAIKEDKRFFQWKNYLKFLIILPLKYFFGYPKIKMIDQ